MRENILERTTVENIITLLQSDLDINAGIECDFKQMREGQLADMGDYLEAKLSDQESNIMLDDIRDFEDIVAEEHLRIGFKAGVKLMNELGKI
jgi:hypothetical protein